MTLPRHTTPPKISATLASQMLGAARPSDPPPTGDVNAVFGPWVDVLSTNLARTRYNAATSQLQVQFRDGSLYQYEHVPASVFQGLLQAPSKGKFLHTRIKGIYRTHRLSG